MFNPLTDKHNKTVFVDGTTQLTNVVGIDSNSEIVYPTGG